MVRTDAFFVVVAGRWCCWFSDSPVCVRVLFFSVRWGGGEGGYTLSASTLATIRRLINYCDYACVWLASRLYGRHAATKRSSEQIERPDRLYADVHFVCILIITGWRRSISFKSGEKRRFRRAAATTLHRFILNVQRASQPNATRVHIGHTISVFELCDSAPFASKRRKPSAPAEPTLVERPGTVPPFATSFVLVHIFVRSSLVEWMACAEPFVSCCCSSVTNVFCTARDRSNLSAVRSIHDYYQTHTILIFFFSYNIFYQHHTSRKPRARPRSQVLRGSSWLDGLLLFCFTFFVVC